MFVNVIAVIFAPTTQVSKSSSFPVSFYEELYLAGFLLTIYKKPKLEGYNVEVKFANAGIRDTTLSAILQLPNLVDTATQPATSWVVLAR